MPLTARDAAVGALRWVAGAAVPAEGGVSWPEEPGYDQLTDELYGGTAGVLIAFAEARLSGISEFDDLASAAVGRIQTVAAAETDRLMRMSVAGGDGPLAAEELGLYTGLAGHATALGIWADVAGDTSAGAWARTIALGLATAATQGPALSDFRDLLLGEAGLVVAMLRYGGDDAAVAAGVIADRLVTQAEWIDDGPDWRVRADFRYLMPNFSHGAAGVGYALALAGAALDR